MHKHLSIIFKSLILPFLLSVSASLKASNPLTEVLEKIEQNDESTTLLRFWNFGEPADQATTKLFNALRNNTHLKSIEISWEAGLGQDEEVGIRFNNACLRNYKDLKKGQTDMNKLKVGAGAVKAMAQALQANRTLETLILPDAILDKKNLPALSTSLKNHSSLKTLTLGIDMGATTAAKIIQNPHLQVVNFSGNVDLTIPENDFFSFIRHVYRHPTLQELKIENCGELYLYKHCLALLSKLVNDNKISLKILTPRFTLERRDLEYGPTYMDKLKETFREEFPEEEQEDQD